MSAAEQQLVTVSSLLQLEKSFRSAATAEELAFLLVNDTRTLINFRHAALWQSNGQGIIAVSNIAVVDKSAPYIVYLKRLSQSLDKRFLTEITPINQEELAEPLANEWVEWLPASALWIPLTAYGNPASAGLLLARDEAWNEAERYLLEHIADSFGHAWQALNPKKTSWFKHLFNHQSLLLILIALGTLSFIPVRMSALAPATVIPSNPTVLTVAIEGVVDEFYIQPNDGVEKSELLLKLEDESLRNELAVTRKTLAIAEAEYKTAQQQAFTNPESKAQLKTLESRIKQQQAEVESMEDKLRRVEIKAPHSGVAIFSDVNDWVGKPVVTGEKILMLANPESVELEIQLPISDAIKLQADSEVVLFLNIEPLKPIEASLSFISYQAEVNSEDQLAYRLKARFEDSGDLPRIGLKGTAKVYGGHVSLAYYLFRKPLAALRQWLGL